MDRSPSSEAGNSFSYSRNPLSLMETEGFFFIMFILMVLYGFSFVAGTILLAI
jgi:hypothetical protein